MIIGRRIIKHIDRLGRKWIKQVSVAKCDHCCCGFERKFTTLFEQAEFHFHSVECQNRSKSCGVLKEKVAKTNVRKYGVSSTLKTDGAIERCNEIHALQSKLIADKRNSTIQKRYGPKGLGSSIMREKIRKTVNERYGVDFVSQEPSISAKMACSISTAFIEGRVRCGYINGKYVSLKGQQSFFYRSTWELAMMQYLDADINVSSWQYECVKISYTYGNRTCWYIPDFTVVYADGRRLMYELKPKAFVNDKKIQAKSISCPIMVSE